MKIQVEFNAKIDSSRLTWASIISVLGVLGLFLALMCDLPKLFLPCMLPMVAGFWSVCAHYSKARFILNNSEQIMKNPNYFFHLLSVSKIAEWTFSSAVAGLIVMIGSWIYISL